jgi:hypothetical protein
MLRTSGMAIVRLVLPSFRSTSAILCARINLGAEGSVMPKYPTARKKLSYRTPQLRLQADSSTFAIGPQLIPPHRPIDLWTSS